MKRIPANLLNNSVKAINHSTLPTCTLPLNFWFQVHFLNHSDFLTTKKTIEDDLILTLKGITDIRNKPDTSVTQLREQLHIKKK